MIQTRNYNFKKFIEKKDKEDYLTEVKLVLCSSHRMLSKYGLEEILRIDLDEQDIQYFKNKYILTELEDKEEELKETLDKVEKLRKDINYLKQ